MRNSCSKMHKLLAKEFEMEDFAIEELPDEAKGVLKVVIEQLNNWRKRYFETPLESVIARHDLWEAILRLLPESYCQKATLLMNYEVLCNIYRQRKNHKLGEWLEFCEFIKSLPYSELITGEEKKQ